MRARKHPLSGRILCGECGAKYNVTFEEKKTKSKGRRFHYSYRLLIHPKPKNCASIAKRVPLELIEDILEDEYQGFILSKSCLPQLAAPEPSDDACLASRPESREERFMTLLKSSLRDLTHQKQRQELRRIASRLLENAKQIQRDLIGSRPTMQSIIDDVCGISQEAHKLYWTWNQIEGDIESLLGPSPSSQLIAPQAPKPTEPGYEYLDAIESATISGKFFVRERIQGSTPRVLNLKFLGAEVLSIPLDEVQ